MKLGYQASDSENAYDFFLGFFFQSDRSTLYQETHSTLNAKKKNRGMAYSGMATTLLWSNFMAQFCFLCLTSLKGDL